MNAALEVVEGLRIGNWDSEMQLEKLVVLNSIMVLSSDNCWLLLPKAATSGSGQLNNGQSIKSIVNGSERWLGRCK